MLGSIKKYQLSDFIAVIEFPINLLIYNTFIQPLATTVFYRLQTCSFYVFMTITRLHISGQKFDQFHCEPEES